MTILDKIRIKKRLRNKNVIRVVIDHDVTKKDIIDYYFKMLSKYGFKMVDKGFNNVECHAFSAWCHPKRASKTTVYKPDAILYADDSVISNLSKKPMCEGCKYINKCHEGGDYLNG